MAVTELAVNGELLSSDNGIPFAMRSLKYTPVVIPNGQSLSASIPTPKNNPLALLMPAAWDAATISYQVSADGVTWFDLYDNAGNLVNHQAAANRAVVIYVEAVFFWDWLKIRSGTPTAPVNQTVARTLTLVTA